MALRGLLLAWCCVGLLALWAPASSARGVSISLRARWNGTSYLHEAAEFLVRDAWCLGQDPECNCCQGKHDPLP